MCKGISIYGEKLKEQGTVAKVLVEKFDIKPVGTVEEDIGAMMSGKYQIFSEGGKTNRKVALCSL